jgi:hypothetical protein
MFTKMKTRDILGIFILTIIGTTFLSCSNFQDMSKKQKKTLKEKPILPQQGEEVAPSREGTPSGTEKDTSDVNPFPEKREIPIGIPVTKEEMKKLKEDAKKMNPKTTKKKAPDKNS